MFFALILLVNFVFYSIIPTLKGARSDSVTNSSAGGCKVEASMTREETLTVIDVMCLFYHYF